MHHLPYIRSLVEGGGLDYRKSVTGQGLRVGLPISTVWMAPSGESTNVHIVGGIFVEAIYM